jgi:hypothetical protein
MMGMWILALMVLAALAIDVSRLAFTATEVQAVADVAATAAVKTAAQGGNYAVIAKAAAAKNRADGDFFDVVGQPSLYTLDPIQAGTYDNTKAPGVDPFTAGAAPWNAVRVTARAEQVGFIFGGFMSALANFVNAGSGPISTSTPITKTATAVCAPPLAVPPDLPMSVCPAGNIQLHVVATGEACDPSVLGIISPLNPLPNTTQDGCWNDLGTNIGSNPSNAALLALFPADCGGSTHPILSDFNNSDVNNGDHSNLLSNLISCINNSPYNGTRNFTIPVTDCGSCSNRVAPVQGFVTIQIKASDVKTNNNAGATFGSCNVNCSLQPSGKCVQGIYCAKQVCNPSGVGEGIGTGNFGDCIVRLG